VDRFYSGYNIKFILLVFAHSFLKFSGYFNRPGSTTEAAFDKDGFFRTGDIGLYDSEKKSYKILGRASVDIIKSGGFKISALDIERILLTHDHISESVVFGMEDPTWGEKVRYK